MVVPVAAVVVADDGLAALAQPDPSTAAAETRRTAAAAYRWLRISSISAPASPLKVARDRFGRLGEVLRASFCRTRPDRAWFATGQFRSVASGLEFSLCP